MLKQDSVIKQINSKVAKIDDEFQNIENIMMRISFHWSYREEHENE